MHTLLNTIYLDYEQRKDYKLYLPFKLQQIGIQNELGKIYYSYSVSSKKIVVITTKRSKQQDKFIKLDNFFFFFGFILRQNLATETKIRNVNLDMLSSARLLETVCNKERKSLILKTERLKRCIS